MFNLRWSVIAGGIAFVLSFLIGLISGTGLFSLVRAGIFGILFFLMGSGVYWVVNMFLSELFDSPVRGGAGSKVDITVEGEDGFIAESGLDGLSDLVGEAPLSPALDQGDGIDSPRDRLGSPVAGSYAIPIDGTDEMDTLPSFEGAGTFQPLEVEETMENPTIPPPVDRKPSLNSAKPAELDGDFRPKEIAQAIQTILKRE